MNAKWTKYNITESVVAGYSFDKNGEVLIKLFTKVPKGYYYSFLNWAGEHFDEFIKPSL